MRKTKNGGNEDRLTVIKVKVIPRSSRNQIIGTEGDTLKVKVTSTPVNGKANKSLVEMFAKHLGIPKKDIKIIAGEHSRRKHLKILGISKEEILSMFRHLTS